MNDTEASPAEERARGRPGGSARGVFEKVSR